MHTVPPLCRRGPFEPRVTRRRLGESKKIKSLDYAPIPPPPSCSCLWCQCARYEQVIARTTMTSAPVPSMVYLPMSPPHRYLRTRPVHCSFPQHSPCAVCEKKPVRLLTSPRLVGIFSLRFPGQCSMITNKNQCTEAKMGCQSLLPLRTYPPSGPSYHLLAVTTANSVYLTCSLTHQPRAGS